VVRVVEVGEHDDAVAPREAPVGQVRADEARAARDQQPHGRGVGTGVGLFSRAGSAALPRLRTVSLYSFRMPARWRFRINHRRSVDSSIPTTTWEAASKMAGSLMSLPAVPCPESSLRPIESRLLLKPRRFCVNSFPNF